MKPKVKRAIGLTMLILMSVTLYVTLFVSACGVLVERGWEFWDAIRALVTLLVGYPLIVGYVLLALRLYLDREDD